MLQMYSLSVQSHNVVQYETETKRLDKTKDSVLQKQLLKVPLCTVCVCDALYKSRMDHLTADLCNNDEKFEWK